MADKNISNWIKYMALGTSISVSFAGLVGVGYYLGNYLDLIWGTDPWLKISLMIFGVIIGIAYLIVTINKIGKSNNE